MAFPKATRSFASVLRAGGFLTRENGRLLGIKVINKSGSDIAADKLVAVSGFDVTTKLVKVVLADADAADLATDVYVALQKITNGKQGNVFKGGRSAATLDTSGATTVGDPIYLSTTAGGFTSTAPTTTNARVQIVGYSTVKSASVGQIQWDIKPPTSFGSFDQTGGTADGNVLVSTGSISTANIIGTSAGQLGHANGVVLVAPGGATVINQLVFAIIENDFLTAAFTGGGATGIKLGGGGVAVSNTVTAAVFIQAAADISVQLGPEPSLTVASVYTLNNSLNLVTGSAPTQPGTAAGVIKWKIGFRAINTQLD